ncbi:MAG TPA: hypothetical protein VNQ80_09450 [Parapedobacter sp.]|nr:hypothetical protein [Parapedobacter sp.]HWK57552.1 hypothetical protein [Parapedobacter sp.]
MRRHEPLIGDGDSGAMSAGDVFDLDIGREPVDRIGFQREGE